MGFQSSELSTTYCKKGQETAWLGKRGIIYFSFSRSSGLDGLWKHIIVRSLLCETIVLITELRKVCKKLWMFQAVSSEVLCLNSKLYLQLLKLESCLVKWFPFSPFLIFLKFMFKISILLFKKKKSNKVNIFTVKFWTVRWTRVFPPVSSYVFCFVGSMWVQLLSKKSVLFLLNVQQRSWKWY